MAKKDKPTNNPGIKDIMMGAKTATTKAVSKVVETSNQESPAETNTTETAATIINTEVSEDYSSVIETEKPQEPVTVANADTETTTNATHEETGITNDSTATNESTTDECTTEETSTNTQFIPKKIQVNMNEEDLKALNNTVSKTGLKRTKLVNQMLEFALTCKDDFIKYHSEKGKEPVISSVIKDQEGRPKFCVKTVKKSRKDNFLLIASADLIEKVDILAKELEISRNKFVNEAILFALESM